MMESQFELFDKKVDPKVYSVVFRKEREDHANQMALFSCIAYSLEEAYELFRNTMPVHETWLPYMWHFTTLDKLLLMSQISTKIKPKKKLKVKQDVVEPINPKNELMKKIIESRDVKLFEENIHQFTKEEKKFILDKINKKNDDKSIS